MGLSLLITGLRLTAAAQQPVGAYLVLGGSIRREIYVAEHSAPDLPILISAGSADPCVRLLFEAAAADLDRVWLEKCARSTFGNFVYSLPVLKRWRVRRVQLVTSGSQTRRAVWMGRLILGAHQIWVDPLQVPETGVPGNQESSLKTILDISRSVLWAMVSQVYQPQCREVMPLTQVDLAAWRQRGFKCEHQSGIEGS
jgi:uncharacterized SAM-binding protein YcdF (DUF218 family)